jgi:hypothetical protein
MTAEVLLQEDLLALRCEARPCCKLRRPRVLLSSRCWWYVPPKRLFSLEPHVHTPEDRILQSYKLFSLFTSHQIPKVVFRSTGISQQITNFVFLRSVRRLLVTANVVPSSLIRHPDDGGAKFLPKRRFLQEPHGVTSHTRTFFLVTAVKTSNLT